MILLRVIDAHAFGQYLVDWQLSLRNSNECGGCEADFLDLVFKALNEWPTLTAESEWVRTEERLPETGRPDTYGVSDRMWICVKTKNGGRQIRQSRMLDGHWLHVSDDEIVTHWMPCTAPMPPSEFEG